MSASKPVTEEPWIDPDDAPEWTEEHFRHAQLSVGGKTIRKAVGSFSSPGRPRSPNPKKQVTLRLDPDVLDAFRSTGKGWQSRINAALREKLGI